MDDTDDNSPRPQVRFQPQEEFAGPKAAAVKLLEDKIEEAMQGRVERLVIITIQPDGNMQFNMCGAGRWPMDALGMLEITHETLKRKVT